MSAHSQGPWNLESVPTGWLVGPGDIEGRNYVADVHKHVPGKGISDEEAKANARLIAAAPELLSACRAALRLLEDIAADQPIWQAPHTRAPRRPA
jgi:hypothetical protein